MEGVCLRKCARSVHLGSDLSILGDDLSLYEMRHENYLDSWFAFAYRVHVVTNNFKKGSTVWLVSNIGWEDTLKGQSLVCTQKVTLTSYGNQQGTAMFQQGGRNIKKRIYPHEVLLETLAEVRELAQTKGLAASPEYIARAIQLQSEWLSRFQQTAKPLIVETAIKELARLREMSPSCRLWLNDGDNQTEEIFTSSEHFPPAYCVACRATYHITHFCPEKFGQ